MIFCPPGNTRANTAGMLYCPSVLVPNLKKKNEHITASRDLQVVNVRARILVKNAWKGTRDEWTSKSSSKECTERASW